MLAVAFLGIGCASSVEGGVRDEGVDYARFRVVAVDDMCVTTLVETDVRSPYTVGVLTTDNLYPIRHYWGPGTVLSRAPKVPGRGCAGVEGAAVVDWFMGVHSLPYCRVAPYEEGSEVRPGVEYECGGMPPIHPSGLEHG